MRIYLFLIALCGVYALLRKGFDPIALKVWFWVSVAIAIPCYFMARSKHAPSRTEAILARVWLTFRRLVCFSGAAFFGAGAVFAVVTRGFASAWVGIVILSLFALAFAWWGVFGTGESRAWSDDRPSHEARKRRYGWK